VGGQSAIDVVLKADTQSLQEVVVIGYGEQKKINMTGAVGTVEKENLEGRAVTNVQELLQGKSPGLNITNNSGAPGSGASINIRGTSTIGGSSGVLVIIDGVPGNIYTIDPNDIESISVLKDAASAAIYGSRAANGVILVTTKKGTSKDLSVTFTTNTGAQNPLHFIDFVGANDFMNLYNLARRNEGNQDQYTADDFERLQNGQLPDHVWYKEMFKKNQLISTNYLSFSGNTEKVRYNVSGSYNYQSGAVENNSYNRYIFRPDLTFKVAEWLDLSSNVQYTETLLDEPQGGVNGALTAATRISPITPIYNEMGQYLGPGGVPGGHPLSLVHQGGATQNKYKEIRAIFSANIKPIAGLSIKPMYSLSTTDQWIDAYTKPITLYNADGSIYSSSPLSQQTVNKTSNTSRTKLTQVTADYQYTLNGLHEFNILAGYSQQYDEYDNFWASRRNMSFAGIYVLDIGQDAIQNGGTKGHDAIQSYFSRLTYNYNQKYLFEMNVRRDGSSRFSDGYRWGTFPSFSAGWNIDQESFFQDNIDFISSMKVRGSYGVLGDALKIGRYETKNLLTFNSKAYAFNGSLVGGAYSNASFKRDISWEKAEMANFGLEMGFLDNRLQLSVDYFKNIRNDILYQAPVPFEYGLAPPTINALKLENKGLEAMLSYKNSRSDWNYGVDFNFNYSKNKVLDLYGSGPWRSGNTFTDVHSQLNMPFGYQAIGLFQSEEEITNSASQVNVKPGNIKYRDVNEDGIINGDDRVILNDNVPIRFGLNFNVSYKDFDLSANVYGVTNNYRYLQGYEGWAFYLTTNARPMHLDSWTPDNLDASYPRITTNMTGNDREYSSYWLRKANYIKFQNVQIGYNVPSSILDKVGIAQARVYLSGQNLGLISNYDGFDPEGGYYPLPRTTSLGLNIKF
ncbi:SusC/RagA family TonB-linked outer membrane protein, partial [Echinicola sediminis]